MNDSLQLMDTRLESIALERPRDWARRREAPKASPILPYFISGEENRLCVFVTKSTPEVLPSGNPLLLTGPSGAGKTVIISHLASRVIEAHGQRDGLILHKPNLSVLYMTANDFHREYTESVAADVLQSLRDEIQNAFILIVEDLHHLQDKQHAQEELALRLDARIKSDLPTLLTCSQLPSELRGMSPDFCGRCVQGLTLPLVLPGRAAQRQILIELLMKHDLSLNESLLSEFISELDPDLSVRGLDGLVRSAVLWCKMNSSEPTTETLQYAIRASGSKKDLSLQNITKAVAKHFKIKRSDLRSSSRKQSLVRARSLAMLLIRDHTNHTMLQIGEYFGGRDHTTVLHALRSTEKRLANDPQLVEACEAINNTLVRDQ